MKTVYSMFLAPKGSMDKFTKLCTLARNLLSEETQEALKTMPPEDKKVVLELAQFISEKGKTGKAVGG